MMFPAFTATPLIRVPKLTVTVVFTVPEAHAYLRPALIPPKVVPLLTASLLIAMEVVINFVDRIEAAMANATITEPVVLATPLAAPPVIFPIAKAITSMKPANAPGILGPRAVPSQTTGIWQKIAPPMAKGLIPTIPNYGATGTAGEKSAVPNVKGSIKWKQVLTLILKAPPIPKAGLLFWVSRKLLP